MAGLVVLAVACFTAVVTENLPAGMLPQLSRGLGVPEHVAGGLVWVFALASAVTATPLVVALRGLARRRLLVGLLAGFVLANAVVALAPSYPVGLAARVVAGVVAGVQWSMVASYAGRLAPAGSTGRAVAIVLGGSTVALSVGVPAGAWLATVSWRIGFAGLSGLGVLLVLAVLALVPEVPGEAAHRPRTPARRLLTRPGTAAVAAASLLVGAGHNALYTYVAPFLGLSAPPGGVAAALLLFGLATIAGNVVAGHPLDRHLRAVAVCATAALGAALLLAAAAAHAAGPVLVAVAVWGVAFGAFPVVCQTAALRVSGETSEIAVSFAITVYNVGIAAGSFLAGIAFHLAGARSVAWLALLLTVAGLLVVLAARRNGFPATGRDRVTLAAGHDRATRRGGGDGGVDGRPGA